MTFQKWQNFMSSLRTISPGRTNSKQKSPVFIMGTTRSGTTALNRALRYGAFYSGWDEGHVLPLMRDLECELDKLVTNWKKRNVVLKQFQVQFVDFSKIKNDLRKSFKKEIERTINYSQPWLDKTPNEKIIKITPIILSMWPEAKIIFVKRRSIDNLLSKIRKFPKGDFENLCKMWSDSMSNWLEVKSQLPEGSYIEIEQMDIINDPTEISKQLGVFLNLNSNNINLVKNVLKNKSHEATENNNYELLSLDELDWSEKNKQIFKDVCGEMTDAYGYSMDKQYYK